MKGIKPHVAAVFGMKREEAQRKQRELQQQAVRAAAAREAARMCQQAAEDRELVREVQEKKKITKEALKAEQRHLWEREKAGTPWW